MHIEIYIYIFIICILLYIKERTQNNLRDKLLYELYQHIKLESISIVDFFQEYDRERKGFFSLEQFHEILKKYDLGLDKQSLVTLGEQFTYNNMTASVGSRKISLNQLIFYFEKFIDEDLKEVYIYIYI